MKWLFVIYVGELKFMKCPIEGLSRDSTSSSFPKLDSDGTREFAIESDATAIDGVGLSCCRCNELSDARRGWCVINIAGSQLQSSSSWGILFSPDKEAS